MFIDSDFNGKSFGQFEEDVMVSNFKNASGYSNAIGDSSIYFPMVSKYGIMPTKSQFLIEGYNCNGWQNSIKCNIPMMLLPKYGSDADITAAYDKVAKTKNSYNYNLVEMKSALADVQSDVDSSIPMSSNMSCLEYTQVIDSLNASASSWNSSAVAKEFDRDLRAAYLSAIAGNVTQASSYMDARDCTGSTSAIDTAQEIADAADAAATQSALDSASATAKAIKDTKDAQDRAAKNIKAQKSSSSQAIAELKSEAEANRIVAEEEKVALDKRNKMIMYAAGVVILILIIKK